MALVTVMQVAFLLLAVLQQQINAAGQSGLILLSCPDTPCSDSTAGPCFVRGQRPIRRDDYTYIPGIGGYKLHTRAVPWNEGRMICEEEGGHLAIINSIAEAKAITEVFKNAEPIIGTENDSIASIGFHDLYNKRQWVTIHGQSLAKAGFTLWARGEPNDVGGVERCGSFAKSGGLNDVNCELAIGVICEIPIL